MNDVSNLKMAVIFLPKQLKKKTAENVKNQSNWMSQIKHYVKTLTLLQFDSWLLCTLCLVKGIDRVLLKSW